MKPARGAVVSLISYSARRQTARRTLGISYVVLRFLARRLKTRNRTVLTFKVEPGARYEIVGIRRGD